MNTSPFLYLKMAILIKVSVTLREKDEQDKAFCVDDPDEVNQDQEKTQMMVLSCAQGWVGVRRTEQCM